jgi:ABC-2 type transport system permease protein
MALTALAAIVAKDLRLFLTDRRAVMMSFAAPIVIASFFGAIFSSSVHGMAERARMAIYVVDRDRSPIARAIVAAVEDDRNLSVSVSRDPDDAWMAVGRGAVVAAVIIPPGFGDDAGRAFFGNPSRPELKFLYDPTHMAELAMVRGIVTEHVMRVITRELWAGRLTLPYEIHEQAVTAGGQVPHNSYAHAFAGMGVQFLLFAAVDLGIGILVDRQRGVWKRIRSAPLSRTIVLGGKGASGAIITLLTLLVSFAFAMLVFKVKILGSVLGFVAISVACALMATTFGLLLAALGGTPSATRGVATFAVLVFVMLGGAWVPTFIFPAWLQQLTLVVPVRWAMDGLDGMTWRGLPFAYAVAPTVVLLGFAVLFGVLALAKFRWNE